MGSGSQRGRKNSVRWETMSCFLILSPKVSAAPAPSLHTCSPIRGATAPQLQRVCSGNFAAALQNLVGQRWTQQSGAQPHGLLRLQSGRLPLPNFPRPRHLPRVPWRAKNLGGGIFHRLSEHVASNTVMSSLTQPERKHYMLCKKTA